MSKFRSAPRAILIQQQHSILFSSKLRVWSMTCVTCQDESKKCPYRCPQCKSPYCSVICYKQHKVVCAPPQLDESNKQASETQTPTQTEIREEGEQIYSDVLNNSRIQDLLKSEGVSKYLRVVAEILHDPKLSGEHSAEGRRIVALKKLRELRKGGREANEAIEELATEVVKLVEKNSGTGTTEVRNENRLD